MPPPDFGWTRRAVQAEEVADLPNTKFAEKCTCSCVTCSQSGGPQAPVYPWKMRNEICDPCWSKGHFYKGNTAGDSSLCKQQGSAALETGQTKHPLGPLKPPIYVVAGSVPLRLTNVMDRCRVAQACISWLWSGPGSIYCEVFTTRKSRHHVQG